MSQTLAISKRITSLAQLHQQFPGLAAAATDDFFPEWQQPLPDLSVPEQQALDLAYQRYYRYRLQGELSEGTVKLLLVFPLLELAGFYDEPFLIATEAPVELVIPDQAITDPAIPGQTEQTQVLTGRIDALVVRDHLWVVMVESKRSVAFSAAIPQALAYMLATPQPQHPVYGLVTDGDLFMFIKLEQQPQLRYDFSEPISLFVPRRNRLYEVMRVLKGLAAQFKE